MLRLFTLLVVGISLIVLGCSSDSSGNNSNKGELDETFDNDGFAQLQLESQVKPTDAQKAAIQQRLSEIQKKLNPTNSKRHSPRSHSKLGKSFDNDLSWGYDLAKSKDNKIVAVGGIWVYNIEIDTYHLDLLVARFNPDGTLDLTFAGQGYHTYNTSWYYETDEVAWVYSDEEGTGVVVDSDNRIIVSGWVNDHLYTKKTNQTRFIWENQADAMFWRILEDGSLDDTFGGGKGYCRIDTSYTDATPTDHPLNEVAYDVAIDTDGNVYGCGFAEKYRELVVDIGVDQDMAAWKVSPAGVLTTTFTSDHVIGNADYFAYEGANRLCKKNDAIFVAGWVDGWDLTNTYYEEQAALWKLDLDLVLSTGFGGDGIVTYGTISTTIYGYDEWFNDAAVDSEGRVIAVGGTQRWGFVDPDFSTIDALVVRFAADGTLLDEGILDNVSIAVGEEEATCVRTTGTTIYVGGVAQNAQDGAALFVARVTGDWELDSHYNDVGYVVHSPTEDDPVFSMLLDNGGHLFLVGYSIYWSIWWDTDLIGMTVFSIR